MAKKIIGIAGSVRKKSFNGYLLNAAREFAPSSIELEIVSIADVPLYNGDVEALGIPASVAALKEIVANSDGLLLVTPEYNHSLPGVFKNAIDWMSRPDTDIGRVFGNKPVAIMGASNGRGGTRFSQTAWLQVFGALSLRPWLDRSLYLGNAADVFDESGRLVDEKIAGILKTFMSEYAQFVNKT